MILALAGGVGGAKLADGLATNCLPENLLIVVNTGDDFEHLGFGISPDIDTVMYWLAGMNDGIRGWGVRNETWNFMAALKGLGGPTWFNLGDRDLATHVQRTLLLSQGQSLSDVTRQLCKSLNVRHTIIPMTDERVRTIVKTTAGDLDFQDYFVRLKCEPRFTGIELKTVDASPSAQFFEALQRRDLEAIIICPSNPILSIEPILAVDGVREAIKGHAAPVVAISPFVKGQAIKGPAAKIFQELGLESTSLGVARHYAGLIDALVIDYEDESEAPEIEQLGIRVYATKTVMRTREDRHELAAQVVRFAATLGDLAHA